METMVDGELQQTKQMRIDEIFKYLPHRYPMLLVDRVLEVGPNRSVSIKNVTINEPFFAGHYPEVPIMPGVLIIEAMAQAGAMVVLQDPQYEGLIPVIGAIDEVKFKRQVVPGDQLRTEVELQWMKSNIGRIKCCATVDGEIAATMELTFKLIPKG